MQRSRHELPASVASNRASVTSQPSTAHRPMLAIAARFLSAVAFVAVPDLACGSWFHPGANDPIGSSSAMQVHHEQQWRKDLQAQSLVHLRPILTSVSFPTHQCGQHGTVARMAFFPNDGSSTVIDTCASDHRPVLSQVERLCASHTCALSTPVMSTILANCATSGLANFNNATNPSTSEIRETHRDLFEEYADNQVRMEQFSNGYVENFLNAVQLEEQGDISGSYQAYSLVLGKYEHSQFYMWPPLAEIAATKVRALGHGNLDAWFVQSTIVSATFWLAVQDPRMVRWRAR